MPDTLPLSAVQHYLYCPRQCALIHVEKVWVENQFTAEGRLLHLRADSGSCGRRGGLTIDRAVPVRSNRLGLYGVADVVEMRPDSAGNEVPYPVEYKRGSPKVADWDRAQLCAQAMCLEEMLSVCIEKGAIFYGTPRRREEVVFSHPLRRVVHEVCSALHAMIHGAQLPPAVLSKKCRGCSLAFACMPEKKPRSVTAYLQAGLNP